MYHVSICFYLIFLFINYGDTPLYLFNIQYKDKMIIKKINFYIKKKSKKIRKKYYQINIKSLCVSKYNNF